MKGKVDVTTRKVYIVSKFTCTSESGSLAEIRPGMTFLTLEGNVLENFSEFMLITDSYISARIYFNNHRSKVKRIRMGEFIVTECILFSAMITKTGKFKHILVEAISEMSFDLVVRGTNKHIRKLYCETDFQKLCFYCTKQIKDLREKELLDNTEKVCIKCEEEILINEEELII